MTMLPAPTTKGDSNEHNNVMRRLAKREKMPLFDFAKLMPKGKKYWDDGRHVNKEGALVKAGIFSDFICEIKEEESMRQARFHQALSGHS